MAMSNDTGLLQQAIVTQLSNDAILTGLLGGSKIYDRPKEGAALPYVTLGMTRAFDASTASERAQEHLFTLHVWSRERGRKDAFVMLTAMRDALETMQAMQGVMRVVSMMYQSQDLRFDEDVSAYHGTLRYRAVTEALTLSA
jgi:Protein of unknown function (DUF3168)